ncbi:hypothetical protein [Streptomyces sp. MP131-18]|uniref:hypothetical protein n=1 Tax=Streptomyces sp. MP131-18 TaxID=1857892 RepID=UPI00097CADC2|nr:hypothetical protein [Streptomyces sp. MP131-18]ONK10402.1 hypothetical protein STBA_11240 [Streptomyces sp. MP131-18]
MITEVTWRHRKEINKGQLDADLVRAAERGLSVHDRTDRDPSGQPVRVVWVAGSQTGVLVGAYEITGEDS